MNRLSEADVEAVALEWLSDLGWLVLPGPDIAPDTSHAERASYSQVILERRLRDALAQLNPELPVSSLDDAFKNWHVLKVQHLEPAIGPVIGCWWTG